MIDYHSFILKWLDFFCQFEHSVQKGGGEYNGICEENFHLLLEKKNWFLVCCISYELH